MSETQGGKAGAPQAACRVQTEGGVGRITLTQAARRNPINPVLLHELLAALDRFEADSNCRAIVLTGEGPAFCGGADLEQLLVEGVDVEWQFQVVRDCNRLVRRIRECELPVIAAVNGAAVGGGAALALACDLALASSGAVLHFAFGRVGAAAADMGCSYFLAKHVGAMRARHLALTGASVDARQGKELGLFLDVVGAADLVPAAERLARQIADAQPRRAAALTKLALLRGESEPLEALLDYEAYAQNYLFRREEHAQKLREFWGSRRRK